MGGLEWGLVGAAILLAVVAMSQVWAQLRARRTVGQPVPALSPPLPARGSALVHFTSPTCAPCRAMRPAIQALEAEGAPIFEVDVSRDLEIALAWKVMATPTTVAVKDGRIASVLLGIARKDQLEQMLGR